MILIHAAHKSNRLRYVLDHIFQEVYGLDYRISTEKEEYLSYDGPKIQYGNERLDDAPFIRSFPLLEQEGIGNPDPLVFHYEQTPAIFQTNNSDWPFDLFSAVFFMLSRYEEYQPFLRDAHGRFSADQSLAYKNAFLDQPVVDIWLRHFREYLSKKYGALPFRKPEYRFIPTYDIDIAWSYLHKGLVRTVGGFLKALFTGNFIDFYYRAATLLHLREDPYYTYDYLTSLHKKWDLSPLFFILIGDFDEYDKNISFTEPAFRELIKHLDDIARVGLHPSYASNFKPEKLPIEKLRLEEIIHRKVLHSRQHYLMMELPVTMERLLHAGIRNDYTLGYTTHPGFRAGTCTPFYFYNLQLEQITDLKMHPFALMDANFRYYMNIAPEEMPQKAKPIVDAVKREGGTLYTLWHNNSFSEVFEWKGWRKPYEELIAYALVE